MHKPTDKNLNKNVALTGDIEMPDLAPLSAGLIKIPLPEDWREHNTLVLKTYYPDGRKMNTWSWSIKSPAQIASELVDTISKGTITVSESADDITMEASGVSITIDKNTGYLINVRNPKSSILFNNGPLLAFGEFECAGINHYADGIKHIVKITTEGNTRQMVWTMYPSGWVQLDYGYSFYGEMDFAGINFSFPEENITGMKWLGRGPYRVWKNRMKGVFFGLYHKNYNNTITGASWDYPEFKGYHSDFYWATFENKDLPFTIVSGSPDIFLRMYTPQHPLESNRATVFPAFPEGDISFLHGITPIGTKTQPASELGPQGYTNMLYSMTGDILKMKLYFDFRIK